MLKNEEIIEENTKDESENVLELEDSALENVAGGLVQLVNPSSARP